ncbi:4-phosphoerythronate dehydrogenase PdxB [Porphyromonas gingivalis]|uniref:4-phosphoerythronate dehydrogenase PdxB n=1 Tax=Porphyromonas gingivalis TaxID=837 RepID=UPI0009750651|nr:4-phosphoerythronate dehydrogenase PdxB [Porphyromonas gingivalis]ATR92695.1 4-phosphoerythronate dehydrogenase PdxB [Porphyromonas gingivalis]ATS09054.1 4-phosphoerythronate dehydrogenase PdxB [Porphyromonas gingivalis]MCE8165409.1 4-phosphoerythronate dehydrogenase PdxB [Porphyromonas gingivalis]MCE8181593.1 4-phosphoerythronate dehydrogenase PdxB [Porphyromonas gingivalis]MCE8189089.1 4-phosphoerythronate dehydrogenase PdxB [Porphyromonas gingivalis]
MLSSPSGPLKIVAEASVPYLRGIVDPVAAITYLHSDCFSPDTIRHARVLIVRSITKCTPALLQGTDVRLITTATAGFDHIDREYCESHGILWRNSPGCNATAVAQYVMCCLCRLALREGFSLKEKVMGIVGVGHVGGELKRLASAYGMEFLLCDPPRSEAEQDNSFLPLSRLAEQCDIISFHVPLTHEGPHATYHLIDEAFLRSCADKRPILINACRGAVANTQALIRAVKSGWLQALVIDCWEGEPDIDLSLLDLADIASPHIAGFSADGKANGARMCLEAITEVFGLEFPLLHTLAPPPPTHPIIDLSLFPDHRIERALLHTFDPLVPDRSLRASPKTFEEQRKAYPHPREMKAFTVVGATTEEAKILRGMDFIS